MNTKLARRIGLFAGTATLIGGAVYWTQQELTKEFVGVENSSSVDDFFLISPRQWISNHVDSLQRQAISKATLLIKRTMTEIGVPGLVIGVSVDGRILWREGFGYSNLETVTPCTVDTAMRIASISKPITTSIMAQMYEKNIIDIDKSIETYVPYFPKKVFNNNPTTITPRLLACHKGGIRHYREVKDSQTDGGPEFYIKDRYESIEKAVGIFQDDDLLYDPGHGFKYTTFGYTLLSAAIEGAAKGKFIKLLKNHLNQLGMTETYLDEVNTIIYNRSNYYCKNKHGRVKNAELTDNSYKWAGGGLVSTVQDLLKFGNAMLYSFQQNPSDKPGFLRQGTVNEMWTPVEGTKMNWGLDSGYGLGWTVVPYKSDVGGVQGQNFYVGHGGGAVGASSVLLIFPNNKQEPQKGHPIPHGTVIAIIANLQDVSLHNLSKQIHQFFTEAI